MRYFYNEVLLESGSFRYGEVAIALVIVEGGVVVKSLSRYGIETPVENLFLGTRFSLLKGFLTWEEITQEEFKKKWVEILVSSQ